MKLTIRLFPIFACLALLSTPASGQKQPADFNTFNPHFEVFELPGGTLGNSVQAIVQDSTGFLWFGSQGGLHRYDGQNIRTIHHDPANPKSIASDYVEYIFLDSRGILWLTHYTDGGLTAFDPITETAVRYRHDPNDPASLGDNTNSVVVEDRDGYIWVGGNGGLDRLDCKTGKFKHFRHDPADPRSLSFDRVRALYVDRQGTLWVGTGLPWDSGKELKLGGLNRYDPKTETFTRYLHDPADPHSLANNKVRALLEDSKGNFWVGTAGDGLHRMNRENGTFTRLNFDPKNPGKLTQPILRGTTPAIWSPETHVSCIFEDPQGRIWITAFPGGLNVYDPTSRITRHFEMGKNEGDLATSRLWQTFQTRDGVTWLAGAGGGGVVSKVKLQDNRFSFSNFYNASAANEMGDDLNAILKDGAGIVWAGFNNGSPLIRFDRKTGEAFPLTIGDAPGGAGVRAVSSLSLDREGFLWVGTEKGLFRRDPKTGKFRHYFAQMEDPWFRSVVQDREGYIWAPDWNSGLYRLDPRTGEYVNFPHDPANPKSIGGDAVRGMYVDGQGDIWAGGGGWNDLAFPLFVDRLNPDGKTFTHFVKEKEAGSGMNLTGDEQGNIWFVDNVSSIQKINPADGSRQKFKAAQAMFANVSGGQSIGLARASDGSFWLYDKGLTVFDPKTERFYNFSETHGIPQIGASRHSNLFAAADGEMLIAGDRGLLSFYPKDLNIENSTRPPELRITAFRLLGEPVAPGGGGHHPGILKKPVWQTTDIRLAHDQNVFAFSVACFDFFDPAASQIEFMLEGYDRTGWRKDLRDGETPAYVNVPPGDYTFRVRGADSHGVWNEEGVSLRILISPPWWKTWWAYLAYFLAFLGALRAFVQYRSRALRQQNETLERQVGERTAELNQSLVNLKATQSQLIQSEKLASLGELTAGIAHEIQNPLNFVNNFSELSVDLAEELKLEIGKLEIAENDKEYVGEILGDLASNQEKINHHGKRAASIVTGMLQHSRASSGKKEPTDLNALADEYLRLSYHGLRAKDTSFNANMVTDFDPAVGKVEVIPQDIGRVFLNIINNAFYATTQRKMKEPEGYEPTVTVSSRLIIPPSGRLRGAEFRIKDNGTGIPDDVQARIFQPFFTTKPTGQGTGLGLSLAYDIVVKGHGGTLEVESEEGTGTEFVVRLHLNN